MLKKSILEIFFLRIQQLVPGDFCWFDSFSKSFIVSNLKRQNTQDPNADPSDGETVKKPKADVDSTKLRSFINNLGSDE